MERAKLAAGVLLAGRLTCLSTMPDNHDDLEADLVDGDAEDTLDWPAEQSLTRMFDFSDVSIDVVGPGDAAG